LIKTRPSVLFILLSCTTLFFTSVPAWADWKADVGYTRLAAELGTALPDGTGILVDHVEAAVAVGEYDTWMPDPTNTAFVCKTMVDRTGAAAGVYSGHATSVGRLLYGDPTSMAPGIMEIDVFYAGHWLQNGFLNYGIGWHPAATSSRVANHSWVGRMETDAQNTELLRLLDWVVDRDQFVQSVGLTNSSSSTRPLLASAFNVIAVGRTDGGHSRGTAAVDDMYTGGRARPDLVAPVTSTSAATPIVGAAAALLIQTGHEDPTLSTDPVQSSTISRSGATIYNAERAEVARAALMAGADRFTINSTAADIVDYCLGDERCRGNGLDVRYGAGQLNIYQSYHVIAAGEQNSYEDGGSGVIGPAGFDFDPYFGGANGYNDTATYIFTADADHNLLSASLVWHIAIDGGVWNAFDGAAVLHDMDLELFDVTANQMVAQSAGRSDNSEHLWVALEPGHTYEIQIYPFDEDAFDWRYALAWTTRADADQDLISDDLGNCRLTPNQSQVDSDLDGFGNRCDCDVDGAAGDDGVVDASDFAVFRGAYGGYGPGLISGAPGIVTDPSVNWNLDADFNGDNVVAAADFAIFRVRYGSTAPFE
jgi:hypothetical protein